jgi:hypothetical protein
VPCGNGALVGGTDERHPAQVLFRVVARGGGERTGAHRIEQHIGDRVGQRIGRRRHEHRTLLAQHAAVGRDVGGHDRPAGREVVEDLQR